MKNYDVVVIGAGPAGLAAATALGRSLRSVLVLDAGSPRNASSPAAHNMLALEGVSPIELLEASREQAVKYGVEFSHQEVRKLEGNLTDGFLVHAATDIYRARRIVIATGLRDELPEIPGLREGWGVSVLHCPYCHGWEVRGQRIAILGVGAMSTHQAQLFRQLSDKVTFINHDPAMLSAEDRAVLDALEIPVVDSAIAALEIDSKGQLQSIELADGSRREFDAAVVMGSMRVNAQPYLDLGGELAEHPLGLYIETGPMGSTAVPGVYAAGNVADLSAMVLASAAAGVMAGAAINFELVAETTQKALKEGSPSNVG